MMFLILTSMKNRNLLANRISYQSGCVVAVLWQSLQSLVSSQSMSSTHTAKVQQLLQSWTQGSGSLAEVSPSRRQVAFHVLVVKMKRLVAEGGKVYIECLWMLERPKSGAFHLFWVAHMFKYLVFILVFVFIPVVHWLFCSILISVWSQTCLLDLQIAAPDSVSALVVEIYNQGHYSHTSAAMYKPVYSLIRMRHF